MSCPMVINQKRERNDEHHKHDVKVLSKMQEASENPKNNKVDCIQRKIAEKCIYKTQATINDVGMLKLPD